MTLAKLTTLVFVLPNENIRPTGGKYKLAIYPITKHVHRLTSCALTSQHRLPRRQRNLVFYGQDQIIKLLFH